MGRRRLAPATRYAQPSHREWRRGPLRWGARRVLDVRVRTERWRGRKSEQTLIACVMFAGSAVVVVSRRVLGGGFGCGEGVLNAGQE